MFLSSLLAVRLRTGYIKFNPIKLLQFFDLILPAWVKLQIKSLRISVIMKSHRAQSLLHLGSFALGNFREDVSVADKPSILGVMYVPDVEVEIQHTLSNFLRVSKNLVSRSGDHSHLSRLKLVYKRRIQQLFLVDPLNIEASSSGYVFSRNERIPVSIYTSTF